MYVWYKFCAVKTSNSAVNTTQLCNQALIGTQISSSMFAGGSTVVFCYYLLGDDTAILGGLYARLCQAFLWFNYCCNNRSSQFSHMPLRLDKKQMFQRIWTIR